MIDLCTFRSRARAARVVPQKEGHSAMSYIYIYIYIHLSIFVFKLPVYMIDLGTFRALTGGQLELCVARGGTVRCRICIYIHPYLYMYLNHLCI